MTGESGYILHPSGIRMRSRAVVHRDQEYEEASFEMLRDIQDSHFWYEGRHRFLLQALEAELRNHSAGALSAIDLGGGCGGWINYLGHHLRCPFAELALADSSLRALELAKTVVPGSVSRYQVDLCSLDWEKRWDVAFLLDVLEHLPDDLLALKEVQRALRPGGLLFVTTPALKFFWSYNDELARHVRRYTGREFMQLAAQSGLVLKRSRYFMFFLSPLLWLSRLRRIDVKKMTPEEVQALLKRTHRVPAKPLNELLKFVFGLETPLGLRLPFPWGTSILGVFQKEP